MTHDPRDVETMAAMTDLVEKVTAEFWAAVMADDPRARDFTPAELFPGAIKAIAAVLDDLMEPSLDLCRDGAAVIDVRDATQQSLQSSTEAAAWDVWQAMLTAKRKELSL